MVNRYFINKGKYIFGYYLKRPEVIRAYKEIKLLENKSIEDLTEYQNEKLRELIKYAAREVPYYTDLFRRLQLTPDDIKTVDDLVKLPILTKEMIKENPQNFISKSYAGKIISGSTGGSTGVPLKYKMGNEDYSRGIALLLRGFEYGGYEFGNSMAIIAGSSLTSKKQSIKSKFQDWIMNINHFSSYGMSEIELNKYYKYLNKKKPNYLRGYASSLYLLAQYIQKNNLTMSYKIKAIYSTAEKLLPNQRRLIESTFETKVYDNYGLNDGGVSAFECEMHNGMHVDYERAILEITNESGKENLIDQQGKILATSLYNYAMPFIRYDTGDLGEISSRKCKCGNVRPLLKEITGRSTDYLKLKGVYIGSPVLTVLMGKVEVESYQIVQTGDNHIQINLIRNEKYKLSDENFIINSFREHVNDVVIEFNYLESMDKLVEKDKKHKFIINNYYR